MIHAVPPETLHLVIDPDGEAHVFGDPASKTWIATFANGRTAEQFVEWAKASGSFMYGVRDEH